MDSDGGGRMDNDRKFTQNARKIIKIATITKKMDWKVSNTTYNMFGKVLVKFGDDCLSSVSSSPSLPILFFIECTFIFIYRSIRKTILIAIFKKMNSCAVLPKKVLYGE